MKEAVTKMIVGTTTTHVDVTITEPALELLDALPSATGKRDLQDHRPLLTVLAIGRAAAGELFGGAMTVEATDIASILAGRTAPEPPREPLSPNDGDDEHGGSGDRRRQGRSRR